MIGVLIVRGILNRTVWITFLVIFLSGLSIVGYCTESIDGKLCSAGEWFISNVYVDVERQENGHFGVKAGNIVAVLDGHRRSFPVGEIYFRDKRISGDKVGFPGVLVILPSPYQDLRMSLKSDIEKDSI